MTGANRSRERHTRRTGTARALYSFLLRPAEVASLTPSRLRLRRFPRLGTWAAALAGSAPPPGGPVRSPGRSGPAVQDGVVASGRDSRAGGGRDGLRSRATSSRSGLLRLLPIRAASLAAPLALLLAALAFAQPATAQTDVELVGNDGQTFTDATSGTYEKDYATSFTTGNNAEGYVLTRVDVFSKLLEEGVIGDKVDIRIYADASGVPGTWLGLGTKSHGATTGGFARVQVSTYDDLLRTAPAGINLDANTKYWVMVVPSASVTAKASKVLLAGTSSDDEESTGLSGWSLGNHRLFKAKGAGNSWSTTNTDENALGLELRGRAIVTPSAPTGLTVSAGTNSSELGASWTAPSGTITDYDLRYYEGSTDPTDAADWVEEHETNGLGTGDSTSTSVTIKGLKSGTAYRVQVRAGNADREGAWSASVAGTTSAASGTNNAPKAMTSSGNSDNECKLWTDTSQPANMLGAVAAGSRVALDLTTRGTETDVWPTTCDQENNRKVPVFDDQDGAEDLYFTMRYTADNVRGIGGSAPFSLVFGLGRHQLVARAVAIGSQTSVRVDLTARDEHGASASAWVRVGVSALANAAGAPAFSDQVPDQTADTGTAFSLALPAATGGDVSAFSTAITSPYTYAVSGLPAGLSFDAATRTVSGTPRASGTFTVTYTADDADALYSLKDSPGPTDTADAASQTFTIQVESPPEAPTGLAVSAGTNSGELDASWTAPSGTITDYDLRYYAGSADPTDAADWVEEHETDGLGSTDSTATSATIKGLKSGTAYRVQVRAANAVGESAWSSSVAATTSAASGTNHAPKAMTASEAGDNGCKLWTDTSQPANTISAAAGKFVSIDLRTRGTETEEWPATCARGTGNTRAPVFDDRDGDLYYTMRYTLPDNVRGLGGSVPFSLIKGDRSAGEYDRISATAVAIGSATSVRVDLAARDEHGASATAWVRFDVGAIANSAGAPSFSATVPDQTVVTGTAFSLVLPAATGGDVSAFSQAINSPYMYAVSGLPAGLSFDAATRTVSGTPRASGTFTVTYTADDADAFYSRKASPDADDTADAASQTFTIQVSGEAPPLAPTGLAVSAATGLGDALTASWTAPAGIFTGYDYDLRYYAGSTDPTDEALWIGAAGRGASTSATITGLQPNTDYRVQVRAGNAAGKGPWSASADGTTSGSLTLLSARVGSDGTKVTLYYDQRLDPASNPGGGVFTVKVGAADRTPTAVSVTDSTVTLTVARVNAGLPVAVSYDAPATSPIRSLKNGVKAGRIIGLAAINDRGETVPTVSSLAFTGTRTHDRDSSTNAPGKDTYGLGAQIKVEVTFSEAVSVDISRGAPGLRIHLHQDSPAVWAGYVSGSGTTALTFAWTVASGYSSNNGVSDAGIRVKANRIALTGGMIASVATGLPADLTHAVHGPCVCQKVDSSLDGQGPRFVSATVNGDTLKITFDEDLDTTVPTPAPRVCVTATAPGGSARNSCGISGAVGLYDSDNHALVKFGLEEGVSSVEAVTVRYDGLSANRLADATGNAVAAFSDQPVTNTTLALKGFETIGVSEGPQSGSLSVSWTLVDTAGTDPTGYDLRYYAGTEDPPPGREADWIEDAVGLPTDTAGTAKGATIEWLRANTAYRVQVRAKTSAATGPWTSSTSGTTGTPPAGNNAPRVLDEKTADAQGNICKVANVSGPIKLALVVAATGGSTASRQNLVGRPTGNTDTWPAPCTGSGRNLWAPVFDDVDGDKLTISVERHPLPDNVRVKPDANFWVTQRGELGNSDNGTVFFQGQAAFRETAPRAVRAKVTATDPHGESVSVRLSFLVSAVVNDPANGAPTLPEVAELDASPGRAFSHVLPAATGGDNFRSFLTGAARQYYYAVSGLPEGLAFDPETRRIFGTPSETGEFTVTYIADDPDDHGSAYLNPKNVNTNDVATRTFTLNVRPFIERVRIVSAPTHDANGDGRNDTYVKGDKIAFDVEFTEPVEVTGLENPDGLNANHVRMRLQVGPDEVNKRKTTDLKLANVFHGGKTLRFEWEVAAGDNDPDGVFVETFADNSVLKLKGTASIKGRISDLDANVTKTAFITGNAVGEDGLPMSYVNGRVGAAEGPTPVSALVTGETLSVIFDEELERLSAADVEALPLHFAVQGASDNLGNRNAFQHPTGYRIPLGSAKTLVMVLGVPAQAGDKITLTYKLIDHEGPLKDTSGNMAPAFVEFVVKNDTGGGTGSGAEGTLVSNTGQNTDTTNTLGTDQALAFATGSNTLGYRLTKVSVPYSGSVPAASSHTISIESNAANRPAGSLGTLAYGTVSGTTVTYTASGTGIALDARTTYFVVLNSSANTSGSSVQLSGSDSEDAGKADGWSLANRSLFRLWNSVAWSTQGSVSWKIAIQGTATAPDPGPQPQSASVAGTTLKIVFDKALDDTSSESGQHFTVTASDRDYSQRTIAGTTADVTISGATVTVTLDDADGGVKPDEIGSVTYDPPTLSLKAGKGNGRVARFEGFNIETVYDTAVPELKQAAVVQTSKNPDGFRVALYYDEALDPDSVPATTDFGVTLDWTKGTDTGSTEATPNVVAVEGNTVVLTVDLAKAPADEAVDRTYTTADVSYTKGTNNPIRDPAGNEAANVDKDDVDVEEAGAPTVDVAVAGVDDGAEGKLVSNTGQTKSSDAGFAFDRAHQFTVGGTDTGYRLTSVVVPYSFTIPGASAHEIRIHASNSSNRPGASLGTLAYGTVSGLTVTYTASGDGIALDAGTSYFVVLDVTTSASSAPHTKTTTTGNQDSDGLSQWSLANASLWKSRGDNVWQQAGGNNAWQIAIHGKKKGSKPILDLKANGSRLTATFDKSLDPASVPGPDRFRLLHDADLGEELEYGKVSSVAVQGKQVVLKLGFPVFPCSGERPFTLSYASSETGKNLRTMTGELAGDLDAALVTNGQWNKCPAADVSVENDGASGNSGGTPGKQGKSLTVKFDRSLDRGKALKASLFGLAGASDGSAPAVEGATYASDGAAVVLTLARGLGRGETVTLSYTRPRGEPGLWDAEGNQIADFSGVAVPVRTSGAPAATGVELVSDAGDDDTYALGETVRVRVTFDEAVEVDTAGGTPRLAIDMDPAHWGTKRAAYESGSGTASLTFAHEVVQPNVSTRGIAVLANTLEANGGAIRSAATGTDAELGHDGLDHDPAHKVNWRLAPAGTVPVTGLEVVSDAGNDGTYALGDTIRVRVTFGEAVEVDTAGGAPRLAIDMDPAHWGTKWAAYEGGSGTQSLTFAYEVVQPNLSTQGIAVLANTLEANGGTIRAVAGGAHAAFAHTGLGHDPAHKVDWQLPPASAANVPATGAPAIAGTAQVGATLTASAADVADADGLTGATFAWQWVSSDGAADADIAGATGDSYTLTGAEQGRTVKVRASFTDDEGNAETLLSAATATVAARPNRPAAGAPTITGKAQVGETLRASTAGITDEDGLTNAAFAYQWVSTHGGTDTDIAGATASTHTLAEAEEGRTVKVRVSFTDDEGNAETLISAPTRAVLPRPLTASFHDVPAEHDGQRAFSFGLTFSEEVKLSFRKLKEQALTVGNGRVTMAKRVVKGENRRWTITVKPASWEDVTVFLAPAANCRAAGAVCTHGGKPLSNGARAHVVGPPVLSVADARGEEGQDAAITFAVTLSRSASDVVKVDYLTRDGTATADEDYTATRGTLTLAAGETEKTVTVPILDDAIDEGEETFTLKLHNAQGAWLLDDEATGTIENNDPMPKAWTARFGRTVAVHVVDAVEARLEGASDSYLQLGGQRLGGGPEPTETAQRLAPERDLWEEPDPADMPGQDMTPSQLLLGTAFHLVSEPGEDSSGPRLSAWGRVASSGFDGREEKLSLNGTVTTATLGVDGVWKRWLSGLLLAYSEGDGSFTHLDMPGGDVSSSLTSLHPYVAYTLNDRVRLWGTVGYGSGALRLLLEDQRAMDTDLTMTMGALGVRGSLLTPSRAGGLHLDLRSDVLWMVMDSAKADNLAATEAEASRLRLVLEGSRPVALAGGGSFTPSLEIGLRHDGGDAETGTGVEVGGSLRYTSAWGLSIEASLRALVAHEEQGYREWGASGALRFDPGQQGRGLTVSIVPTWGTAASGISRLWDQSTTAGLAPDSPLAQAAAEGRLEAELGYGLLTLKGRALLTPYARVALVESADQAWHLGTRLALAESLNLSVEASRRQRQGDVAAHELALRAILGW